MLYTKDRYWAFCLSFASFTCVIWFVFGALVDVCPGTANRAVPVETVGAVLSCIAAIWLAKGTKKKKLQCINDCTDHRHLLRCLLLCLCLRMYVIMISPSSPCLMSETDVRWTLTLPCSLVDVLSKNHANWKYTLEEWGWWRFKWRYWFTQVNGAFMITYCNTSLLFTLHKIHWLITYFSYSSLFLKLRN